MRPLEEWSEYDLQLLVDNSVQESLTLDYKQSAALAKNDSAKRELAKDVSAFANSAGGRIIYGVIEQGHLPQRIDEGVSPLDFTREWLEQIINSQVSPRIAGLYIKPITLSSGNLAYVINIPPATSMAPHQAPDHRYYRRFNFISKPNGRL